NMFSLGIRFMLGRTQNKSARHAGSATTYYKNIKHHFLFFIFCSICLEVLNTSNSKMAQAKAAMVIRAVMLSPSKRVEVFSLVAFKPIKPKQITIQIGIINFIIRVVQIKRECCAQIVLQLWPKELHQKLS